MLYGRANLTKIDLSSMNQSPRSSGLRILGNYVDQFGFSVSAAGTGRLSVDTYDDIIVWAVCKNSNNFQSPSGLFWSKSFYGNAK